MTRLQDRLVWYLVVVERLVDDACDGFASVCNTDKHRHVIQEPCCQKTAGS